jgi:NADH dehydrogenase
LKARKLEAATQQKAAFPYLTMASLRILILGGGFGAVYTALELDKTLARKEGVEVTLISTDNFLLFTPMLHEVAASDLDPSDIVNPLRRLFRHVRLLEAEATVIDLNNRQVTLSYEAGQKQRDLSYDRLVIATGSEDNFFGNEEIQRQAVTMKTLADAMLLRNRLLGLLESAILEDDPEARRALLTIVVAGGGFAGVETIGALNDFMRSTLRWYPTLAASEIRFVLIHPKAVILPELGEELGRYAQDKLTRRKVEIITDTRVEGYHRGQVKLDRGEPIASATLIWTAGVTPGKVIAGLDCQKRDGRLVVNEHLELPDHPGVWAVGDCMSAIDPATGKPFPTTAQHAVREGKVVARNIVASLATQPQIAFRFKTIGQLAAIGQRTGVAQVWGLRFSGWIAWFMWRSVYLFKLPRLEKKIKVATHWTINLFFSQDPAQLLNALGIEKAYRSLIEGKSLIAVTSAPAEGGVFKDSPGNE